MFELVDFYKHEFKKKKEKKENPSVIYTAKVVERNDATVFSWKPNC